MVMENFAQISARRCVRIIRQLLLPIKILAALLMALIAFSGSAQAKATKNDYLLAAEPAWVAAVRLDSSIPVAHSSMHYDLRDLQVKINGASADRYSHVIRVVDDVAGLGPAAQIEMVFDPNYQNLTIHKLRLVRAGQTIDILRRAKIKLLQRETNLESQMYDGRVTASIVLEDVRVGDHVEYSYTISGSNPVFSGKYSDFFWTVNEIGPTTLYQLRLLAPESRAINYRVGPDTRVTSNIHNGTREILFRRTSSPQIQLDETVPISFYIPDQIQLSEFTDWREVASWGVRLFDSSATIPASVKEEADKIRSSTTNAADRLLYAVNFVQKQIRYFGTEVGPYSHRPAAPGKVLEQRFGDCKDKSALLIAILRELEITADPVLVSTDYLDDVASLLPSAGIFNHVIVRANIGNDTYWLDGTHSYQTGPLSQRQSVGFGKGLVLNSAVREMADLPDASNEERILVDDHFHIASYVEDPVLESRITHNIPRRIR